MEAPDADVRRDADDEKFLFKPAAKLEDNYKYGQENIKDIIACGVKLEKTFIFSDVDYVGWVAGACAGLLAGC